MASDAAPVPLSPAAVDAVWRRHRSQSGDHAFVLLDPEGTVLSWDGAAPDILGYRPEEMLGRPIDVIFTAEDVALGMPAHERRVTEAGARSEDDRWHVRRDGTRVWVTGTIEAVHDEAGQVVALAKVMREQTDLRARLEALSNRAADMDATAQKKATFMASLTHELRNALTPLMNSAALLGRLELDPPADFPVTVLQRQLGILRHLVTDLVEVTRTDVAAIRLAYEEVDLNALLAESASTLAIQPEAQGRVVQLLAPPRPLHAEVDRRRLQQCVFNLLDNAAKYTPVGGRIWLKLAVEDGMAVIRVQDTGIGIAPDFLPRVFELFTREKVDNNLHGLGVGLNVVKEIVSAHGGLVEVTSDGEGKGSEFAIRLPLTRPRAAPV